ncbi:BTAD domain-containing putative transcriptional regulator [Micromonospora sp. WMMD998]|uniref:AfsR/SARP family transcriptional regulator n=1 Tax=Micromonospora sp. WMMD998 TaxID=3016092 RepID=UPI00249C934C|nr:BTAD domain-containing putative transcriptional regulator [Micromonospora sp. WMMD998]WFE37556.1 BTAD domain-containing putative transcriptional regulator [Micromonospora sp. WMMD998]
MITQISQSLGVSRVEIRVLGGIKALVSGLELPLGTPKQKILLAMLGVAANRLVTVEEMVDELWPDAPPRSAIPNVRTYAANLRRAFAEVGGATIVRQQGGYLLSVLPEAVDLIRSQQRFAQGRALARANRCSSAIAVLADALDEWPGPLLAGLSLGRTLAARREAVERDCEDALILLAELYLQTGQSERAVVALRPHAVRDPTRERLQMLLMRALLANEDPAGAIAIYRSARAALDEEMGVQPGPRLDQLHQVAIETRSTMLSAGRPTPPSTADKTRTVNWLPRPTTDFVGREGVVRRLLGSISARSGPAAVVQVIDGMAGCGKTTLAVRLAEMLRADHPDGQLFIDLRGHGEADPLEPAAALATLLRQLGVPSGRVPIDVEERAALWRRELAQRRVVLVLDNAARSDQVIPLLPGGAGTVVLVTARSRLLASELGVPESLDVLSRVDAVRLLASTAGAQRVGEEPEAAAEVVRRCGHLPLAIRLAGARLAHRTSWRVADLASRLAGERGRIDQLAVGDRTLAGAFATSYEPLDDRSRRAFRMLALHPGDDFSSPTAAALVDLPLTDTVRILDDLVDRHLLEDRANDRYRLHDLVREYAAELSRAVDEAHVPLEAMDRLLELCLHAALSVAVGLEARLDLKTLVAERPRRPDLLTAIEPDVEWLERERSTLTAMVAYATRAERDRYAWRLARALWRFFYIRTYFDDILSTHRHGLVAARRIGDLEAVAQMQNYLASAHVRTGNYPAATKLVESAVGLDQRMGNVRRAARFRANLGVIYWLTGRLESAVTLGAQLRREELPNGYVPADLVLPNYGIALAAVGRYAEALGLHRLHLFLARIKADQFQILNALGHVGMVRARMGDHGPAIRIMEASLRLRDRTGHRYGEPELRVELGRALRELRQFDAARHQHETALRLALDNGERHAQCAALNELGTTAEAQGDPAEASRLHDQALKLATRIAHPQEQGRALARLGDLVTGNDPDEARRLRRRALAIFERTGGPEQQLVRTLLQG